MYILNIICIFQALIVEIMLTLCLVLVCCAVWDHRNTHLHDSLSIRFGLTIAGLAMAGVNILIFF